MSDDSLRQHLLNYVGTFEDYARHATDIAPEIIALAETKSDPTVRQWILETGTPAWIASQMDAVRMYVRAGMLSDASVALDRFRQRIDHVKALMREPDRVRGSKQRDSLENARIESAKKKKETRLEEWEEWQALADLIWKRHPGWSVSQVATAVRDELKKLPSADKVDIAKADTIRKRIKKVGKL